MQFTQATFAIGGIITPLLTRPFLAEKINTGTNLEEHVTFLNASLGSHNKPENDSIDVQIVSKAINTIDGYTDDEGRLQKNNSNSYEFGNSSFYDASNTSFVTLTNAIYGTTEVHYAFLISGIIAIVCSLPFLYLLLNTNTKVRDHGSGRVSEDHSATRVLPKSLHSVLALSLFLFFYIYVSIDVTFGSFLMTFVVREFKDVSKSHGAFIVTVYWASFGGSRTLGIFVSKFLTPFRQMTLSGSIMIISFSCLAVTAHYHLITELTVLAAVAAFGMSAVFASALSWSESELLCVTSRLSSGILISGSLGAMLNPMLIGYLMEQFSNMWFCFVPLVQIGLLAAVFIFMNCFNGLYIVRVYGPLHRERTLVVDDSDSQHKPLNTEKESGRRL